ncbi:MAG: DeoR family transcriptional regulator, partial [Actinocatenispora sp.]
SSPAAKAAIGSAASRYVTPGTTVGLDSGTTVTELARRLPDRAGLTVVTHSLTAMAELGDRDDLVLIGLGGLYHQSTRSFAAAGPPSALRSLRVDLVFLSATALAPDGVYCASPFEAESKRALLAAGGRVVLLADASKPLRSAPVRVCGLDRLHAVVTDARLRAEDRLWLVAAVPELRVVPDRVSDRAPD